MDDSELWISSDEEGQEEHKRFESNAIECVDPRRFTLNLKPYGSDGGYHVRHDSKQKQQPQISGFTAGSKKKPAFRMDCRAKAIVHGTLWEGSHVLASLLIYDFVFFSYRNTRIKSADIVFEFRPKHNSKEGNFPTVKKISPYGRHTMMRTTQRETLSKGIEGGVSAGAGVFTGEVKFPIQKTVDKEITHAAEIIGDNPFDDWGNHDTASWSLKENKAQSSGIVSMLRTCILLTRESDKEFELIPNVKAEPDFKTRLGSLFSTGTPDDHVVLDPEFEPWYEDDLFSTDQKRIDRWNLGGENLGDLWDCTFYHEFDQAVKGSKTTVNSDEEVAQVKTVVESKKPST